MNRTCKRLFSAMLILCLMLSMLPGNVFAEEAPAGQLTVQEQITEESVTAEPVTETPTSEEPITEASEVEEPVVEEPEVEEPVVEEPEVEEPVVEEPVVEEPVVEEPVVEEPVVEEPVVEEPVVEEPVVEEPAVEEPAVEEPVVEEPVVDLGQYAVEAAKHGGNQYDRDHVNHIDIACENLTVTIGGKQYSFEFDEDDVKTGKVKVYINGQQYTKTGGTSTDTQNRNQVRMVGTFPTKTAAGDIINYTVEIVTQIHTEEFGDVSVTLRVTSNYWADNNYCPGRDGIDVVLDPGEADYTQLTITKVLSGLSFEKDMTFSFDIKKDGQVVQTVDITVAAGDSAGVVIVPGLPAGDYTVVEQTSGLDVEGYELDVSYSTSKVTVSAGKTADVTVTNSYSPVNSLNPDPGKLVIPFEKIWKDEGNTQYRPESVTVRLYAVGSDSKEELITTQKVTAETEWKCEFDISGVSLVDTSFIVVEDPVTNYEEVESDHKDPEVSFTLPSADGWDKYEPCDNLQIPVVNGDAKSIILAKKGNNFVVWSVNALTAGERTAVVASAAAVNGFNNISLDKTTFISGFGGSHAGMTVTENKVTFVGHNAWSFIAHGTYTRSTAEANSASITNKLIPQKTEIPVIKVWEDSSNQDGLRPASITVQLFADGENTGKTLVLNEATEWTGSFKDLDIYANGEKIVYTVEEEMVAGYDEPVISGSADEGFVVTNCHTPEVVKISGQKTWVDNDNQDGIRPESITVNLLADGEIVQSAEVKADEAGNWSYSFEDLPKYRNGKEIEYTITEAEVPGYTAEVKGYNVTNTHNPATTKVSVAKIWEDNDNQDGKRPNDINVKLLANGEETRKTLVLCDATDWKGSFEDLDVYANGEKIVYTVEEVTVDGYQTVITGSAEKGFVVTNCHTPEVVDISGAKTWNDGNNQDGKRPEKITVRLWADGQEVRTAEVSADTDWSWNFTGLPKFQFGKEINYTITEDQVTGYTPDIDGYNITNKYTPKQTSITVTKAWDDSNNQDGIRPEKVTIQLLANGKKVDSKQIGADENWTWTFDQLDVYANGEEIEYTVEEVTVEGYTTVITGNAVQGFVVTNCHTPEVVDISGAKTWNDGNNQDGKRPEKITVRLWADGQEVRTAEVSADTDWSWNFTGLPKFQFGKEINYTITEDQVTGYTPDIDGYNITNEYTPEQTSITVTKRWVDGHNHDGIRPSSVTVTLYADGVKCADMKLTAKDNWTGVFTNLPMYQNGKKIEYTVLEKSVKGYNATVTGSASKGFVVTNTHNIIPKTGDESNLPLYAGMFGASISVMAVLMFLAKPRKGKFTR